MTEPVVRVFNARQLFITQLWQFQLPELAEYHANWLEVITRLRDKDQRDEVGGRSLVGGWKSPWRLLAHRAFAPLEEQARACFAQVLEQLQAPQNLPFDLQGAVNWSDQYSYNLQHGHAQALLSGVYYLTVPDNSGDLIFHEPRAGAKYSPLRTASPMSSEPVAITPKVGELVIFPAWLEHSVNQSQSDQPRISIPINAVPRR